MNRTEVLNHLIIKYKYETYLEIGLGLARSNFTKIKAETKISIDPHPDYKPTFVGTSDEFFVTNTKDFDLIFIDGYHEKNQVLRDVQNSLNFLSKNGTIVIHDVNPVSYNTQIVPRESGIWNGNVWEAFVELRKRDDLYMFTIEQDNGSGIIRRGKQTPYEWDLTYLEFEKDKRKYLNIQDSEML